MHPLPAHSPPHRSLSRPAACDAVPKDDRRSFRDTREDVQAGLRSVRPASECAEHNAYAAYAVPQERIQQERQRRMEAVKEGRSEREKARENAVRTLTFVLSPVRQGEWLHAPSVVFEIASIVEAFEEAYGHFPLEEHEAVLVWPSGKSLPMNLTAWYQAVCADEGRDIGNDRIEARFTTYHVCPGPPLTADNPHAGIPSKFPSQSVDEGDIVASLNRNLGLPGNEMPIFTHVAPTSAHPFPDQYVSFPRPFPHDTVQFFKRREINAVHAVQHSRDHLARSPFAFTHPLHNNPAPDEQDIASSEEEDYEHARDEEHDVPQVGAAHSAEMDVDLDDAHPPTTQSHDDTDMVLQYPTDDDASSLYTEADNHSERNVYTDARHSADPDVYTDVGARKNPDDARKDPDDDEEDPSEDEDDNGDKSMDEGEEGYAEYEEGDKIAEGVIERKVVRVDNVLYKVRDASGHARWAQAMTPAGTRREQKRLEHATFGTDSAESLDPAQEVGVAQVRNQTLSISTSLTFNDLSPSPPAASLPQPSPSFYAPSNTSTDSLGDVPTWSPRLFNPARSPRRSTSPAAPVRTGAEDLRTKDDLEEGEIEDTGVDKRIRRMEEHEEKNGVLWIDREMETPLPDDEDNTADTAHDVAGSEDERSRAQVRLSDAFSASPLINTIRILQGKTKVPSVVVPPPISRFVAKHTPPDEHILRAPPYFAVAPFDRFGNVRPITPPVHDIVTDIPRTPIIVAYTSIDNPDDLDEVITNAEQDVRHSSPARRTTSPHTERDQTPSTIDEYTRPLTADDVRSAVPSHIHIIHSTDAPKPISKASTPLNYIPPRPTPTPAHPDIPHEQHAAAHALFDTLVNALRRDLNLAERVTDADDLTLQRAELNELINIVTANVTAASNDPFVTSTKTNVGHLNRLKPATLSIVPRSMFYAEDAAAITAMGKSADFDDVAAIHLRWHLQTALQSMYADALSHGLLKTVTDSISFLRTIIIKSTMSAGHNTQTWLTYSEALDHFRNFLITRSQFNIPLLHASERILLAQLYEYAHSSSSSQAMQPMRTIISSILSLDWDRLVTPEIAQNFAAGRYGGPWEMPSVHLQRDQCHL